MFVQVISGPVSDAGAVRAAFDRWMQELQPGATGWLGMTGGVTSEGDLLAAVRFESADAAKRNSERAEQDAWWQETARLFTGDVRFRDSDDVSTWLGGGSDQAGFVQVMEGRDLDRARGDALMKEVEGALAEQRPDVLGGLTVHLADGTYLDVVYFTSEAEAREGEQKPVPDEIARQMGEVWEVTAFHDLREPWLYSA